MQTIAVLFHLFHSPVALPFHPIQGRRRERLHDALPIKIHCRVIWRRILFRILIRSMCLFFSYRQKPCIFHDKPRHRQFRRQITLQCILIGKASWSLSRRLPWIGSSSNERMMNAIVFSSHRFFFCYCRTMKVN
jgi:hypothetical protein